MKNGLSTTKLVVDPFFKCEYGEIFSPLKKEWKKERTTLRNRIRRSSNPTKVLNAENPGTESATGKRIHAPIYLEHFKTFFLFKHLNVKRGMKEKEGSR